MARILIRPEDLARLAQRFDAAADDLVRSGRRLVRSRDEVRFNSADEVFPAARFAERAALVEADLRRLAADFRVDAALMARTVDDADADVEGEGGWTVGLRAGSGGGVGAGPAVGSLDSVVAGLMSLSGRTLATTDDGGFPTTRLVGAGGLFVALSVAGGGHELLTRLTERLEAASSSVSNASGSPSSSRVWTRIVGELFADGSGGDA